jgi:hypothetical protein
MSDWYTPQKDDLWLIASITPDTLMGPLQFLKEFRTLVQGGMKIFPDKVPPVQVVNRQQPVINIPVIVETHVETNVIHESTKRQTGVIQQFVQLVKYFISCMA